MRGIAILIVIVVAMIALFVTFTNLEKNTKDIQEFQTIKSELEACNDKIFLTASSGTISKCEFHRIEAGFL